MDFHHVGVAVHSIEETAKWYVNKGYDMTETFNDPIQKVYIAFLKRSDSPLLELVQPADKISPVSNILKKSGVSAYHFCYETDNLQETIEDMEKQDFKVLIEPVPAVAFNNRKISFLYNIDIGLIELLEK
ncbi:MAG: VOC family protein [Candidatus Azobacteroides sp.]|nr:VOC family protein [Candidatus Azobacteroides sp.]